MLVFGKVYFFWEVESGLFGIFDLKKALKSPDFFVARAKEFENQILVQIMHLRHGCTVHGCSHLLALHPPWQGWTSWKSHPPVQSHSNPHDAKLYISNSENVLTFYVNYVINMFFIHVSLAGENPAGLQTNGAPGLHQLCFGPTNPSLGLLFSFLWASLQIIFVSR